MLLQSAANGDPTPSGVVRWTRIAPEIYEPGRPLVLEVSTRPDVAKPSLNRLAPRRPSRPGKTSAPCPRVDIGPVDRSPWNRSEQPSVGETALGDGGTRAFSHRVQDAPALHRTERLGSDCRPVREAEA